LDSRKRRTTTTNRQAHTKRYFNRYFSKTKLLPRNYRQCLSYHDVSRSSYTCRNTSGRSKEINKFFYIEYRFTVSTTQIREALHQTLELCILSCCDSVCSRKVDKQCFFLCFVSPLFIYCRLFLQVHTIADLSTVERTQVDLSLIQGHPSLLSSTSTEHEIHQDRPETVEAWRVWRKACSLWWDTKPSTLQQPLGPLR
jgi:hypothetical protein